MRRFFTSLPFQLFLTILCAIVASALFPISVITGFFTFSSLVREVLELFLPFIVFFFVGSGILAFRSNSVAMVGIVLALVCASNAVTALYTYFVGVPIAQFFAGASLCSASLAATSTIEPFWSLQLPVLARSEVAMGAALIVGIAGSYFQSMPLIFFLLSGKKAVEWGLKRFFISILPLYVFGFFLKLFTDLPVAALCGTYGAVFVLSILLQLVILVIAYVVASRFSLSRAVGHIVQAAPSYLTALGTMSSVAALPVSVVCAERNTGNKSIAQFAMPIFANVHLMGDAVCVPLFTFTTLALFTGGIPSLPLYLVFVGYLCVTMLAVSGIPGGGIIAMLPLLKGLFGFSPEMLSVMTALYLMQDGFGTAANVMGDGALVMILNRIYRQLFSQNEQTKGVNNGATQR